MATTGTKRRSRGRPCRFCADKTIGIDYKDPKLLRSFITEGGKIVHVASRATARGTSASSPPRSSARGTWPSCRT